MTNADKERIRVEAAWGEYLRAVEEDDQFRQIADAGGIHDYVGRVTLADRAAELGFNGLEEYLRRLAQGGRML